MIVRLICLYMLVWAIGCNNRPRNADPGIKDSLSVPGSYKLSLELVFSDPTFQLTGVAKMPGGNLLVNYPRWSDVYRFGVVQLMSDNSVRPYPDTAWNQWKPGQPGKNKWICVQSVYVDDSARLWVLDPAAPELKTIQDGGAKLIRMDAQTGKPARIYSFNGIIPDTAYMNDVRVDVRQNFAYLTESKGGGIVVVNLEDGKMRRVLAGHPSTQSDPAFRFVIDGRELMKDGKPAKFNSDGIALSPDGDFLYYKPLTDNKLYRIRTEYLRNWDMPDTALSSRVEDLGRFSTSDGMIFDKKGNLYLGDLQNYRIVQIDSTLTMRTLIKDQRLIWPDSYSISEGYLYISCSQIQKQPEYNRGVNKRISAYTVYRVKLPE